jgi:hypothetical protein
MVNYSTINLSVLFIEDPRFPNVGALTIEILNRVGNTGEQEGGV